MIDPSPSSTSAGALFTAARTHYHWLDQPVSDDELRAVYDLLKWGPTSANCSPARFLFLRTPAAKQRLLPALSAGNVASATAAPVVTIVATDPAFFESLPFLYPQADARSWFAGNDDLAAATATRNGTLQGAYLILAARAAGLDCGPMSGFDNELVDREFFATEGWKSNFLVCLGHGDPGADGAPAGERAPRLPFDQACRLL